MTETTENKGRCLCGQISIQVIKMNLHIGACHCSMCRKWGGGPLMASECGSEVTFSGEEHLTVFDSSEWADRGFCSACGTHMFYRLKQSQEYFIPVGLFGDQLNLVFDSQVFIDEKPSFYAFSNETDDLTGAELFAQFGAPPE